MADMRVRRRVAPNAKTSDGALEDVEGSRLGAVFTKDEVERLIDAGYGYYVNFGSQSSPITFAGAYDATAPDGYLYVPNSKLVVPLSMQVTYEAVGTEATMEVIATASATGDSSATATGGGTSTIVNMRLDKTNDSGCTATYGVDASGITTPLSGNYFDFWRKQRPLTDTVASGENDRHELNWQWHYLADGPAPRIYSNTGAGLSIHCASQAGTGFIILSFLSIPKEWVA